MNLYTIRVGAIDCRCELLGDKNILIPFIIIKKVFKHCFRNIESIIVLFAYYYFFDSNFAQEFSLIFKRKLRIMLQINYRWNLKVE